jgi:hypothetical protein
MIISTTLLNFLLTEDRKILIESNSCVFSVGLDVNYHVKKFLTNYWCKTLAWSMEIKSSIFAMEF